MAEVSKSIAFNSFAWVTVISCLPLGVSHSLNYERQRVPRFRPAARPGGLVGGQKFRAPCKFCVICGKKQLQ